MDIALCMIFYSNRIVVCLNKWHYKMNTVDYLLQNSFSSHREEMKLEIKRLGCHIPDNFE